MGGQDSKTLTAEDYFVLEHISKMSLKNRKIISYYFISPEDDKSLGNILPLLRSYFKLDHFKTTKTLKQQLTFVHKHQIVKIIVTPEVSQEDLAYLQSENKISQIVMYGNHKEKGGKIIESPPNEQKLLALLNQLQEKDNLDISSYNLLFLNDQDTKMLNKYRLNYHCNTVYNDRQQAKKDFIELARKMYPQQLESINEFQSSYKLQLEGEQRRKMVLDWAFKNNFYWQLVDELTRNTTDPKRLAYIRLAQKDIFQAVQNEYRSKKIYKQSFVVVNLSEQEAAKLQKSKGNYVLFTSFIKGFSTQAAANKYAKEKTAEKSKPYKFTISSYKGELSQDLDFGYIIRQASGNQPNVILNIYNVFKVEEINSQTGELQYGMLPIIWKKRGQEDFRSKMTKQDLDLVRNYDYLEDLLVRADSQATLLQLSGYHKESVEFYDKKVDNIRKSNESEDAMNRIIVKKADALRISGDFESAEKQFITLLSKSEKTKAIAQIHLAQMYMIDGEDEKFDSTIDKLQPLIKILQKDEKEEYYKGTHYIAIKLIKKGSTKKAEEILQGLITQTSVLYDIGMEGKPLVHDIYRTLATCKSKRGHHEDALKLLNSTLELQLVCEGKTHNVAFTETLIQTVSKSSGNTTQLQNSQKRMKEMSSEIDSSEYRTSGGYGKGINNSLISIDM